MGLGPKEEEGNDKKGGDKKVLGESFNGKRKFNPTVVSWY